MSRFINPIPQYILANGDVAAGGTLTFYESGTDTLLTIYADVNETTPIANPVSLGDRGEVPNIFFSASARCVLNDVGGTQIFDVDPVSSDQGAGEWEIWNSNIVYSQSDIAFGINGLAYISLQNENQGNDPVLDAGANPFWSQLVLPEVYNSSVTYQPNDFAFESGVVYRSLISDNIGNQPSLDDGTRWKSIANGIYVDYDNTSSGLVAVTAQAALDEIVNLINNLPSSVTYRGQLDVSAGDPSLPGSPNNGDLYVIAVGGTITVSVAGGAPVLTAVNVGEQIIYNGTTGNWDLIAAVQQASSVSYNNTASGLTATDVQSAIDEVEGRVDTAEGNISTNASDIITERGRIDSLEAFESSAGTAYTDDSQTSAVDPTVGRLLKLAANEGSFGLGASDFVPAWPNTSLNDITSVASGIYRTIGSTTDSPSTEQGVILYFPRASSASDVTMIFMPAQNSEFAMYYRRATGGPQASPLWSSWATSYDTNNLPLVVDALTITYGSGTSSRFRVQNPSNGTSVVVSTTTGIDLLASGMDTLNKYTPALKFLSTDTAFTTENPRLLAWISAEARETYSTDNTGRADLVFFASPTGQTANAPVEIFRAGTDGVVLNIGNFDAGDSQRIRLGNSNDLQIYHNGSDSLVENSTGAMFLTQQANASLNIASVGGSNIRFRTGAGSPVRMQIENNGVGSWLGGEFIVNKSVYTAAQFVFQPQDNQVADATISLGALECRSNGGATDEAFMAFHRAGAYATYFGLNSDNKFVYGGWSAGAQEFEFYNEANPNTDGQYVTASSLTVNRDAPCQDIDIRIGSNSTISLNGSSAWQDGDKVVIHKSRQDGTMTIQTIGAGGDVIFVPDNTSAGSHTIPSGTSMTVTLTRIGAINDWSLSVQG